MNKSIVITGSTRGIGFHLAAAFLERDCAVTISGRTQVAVDEAINKLGSIYNQERVYGYPCNVIDYEQLHSLWDKARDHFGRIDIWINNAGLSAPMMDFWQLSPEQYAEVVQTNILGIMYGSRVALTGMMAQGSGALYNMEGYGARGIRMRGSALYGSTKAGVHFFDRSLADETQGTRVTVGALAPGMMITDMVTSQFKGREEELARSKRILNIIAERPETVAPVLVEKILSNSKNGVTIAYSSFLKLLVKFLTSPFNKRDLFS